MTELPINVIQGERARLFPILSERSVEGRTTSIFLSTLVHVQPFAGRLLGRLGKRTGPLSRLSAFTEVCFRNADENAKDRPDGLLILDTGRSRWTALVEAKVRRNDLDADQVSKYLKLAKANGVDAVITLSNQFSSIPHHHPISVSVPKGVELFHLSWMQVLTDAYLLLSEGVEDEDQSYVLDEFKRFISHDSAGVESFTQMPSEWSDVVSTIQAGGNVANAQARAVVEAWHQECQDLSLIFSRQIDAGVTQKMTRTHASDQLARVGLGVDELRSDHLLSVELVVPDAAAPVDIKADLMRRTISVAMYLSAPADKKRNPARVNWLLRQFRNGMRKAFTFVPSGPVRRLGRKCH